MDSKLSKTKNPEQFDEYLSMLKKSGYRVKHYYLNGRPAVEVYSVNALSKTTTKFETWQLIAALWTRTK